MRRIIHFAAACLALTLLFQAGCLLKPKESAVRVAVFTTDPILIKILNDTIKGIESRHPGLKVKVENIPYNSYMDKITMEMGANDAPDVISVEASNFPDMYTRGAFENLMPFFQADKMDPNDYYSSALKRYSPDGGLYAIPTDIAPTGLLYYNKKLFDEAGVPYPTPEWKWPEPFLTYCKKFVKKDAKGRITQWAFADPYGTNADIFMFSNGGYFMDSEDHPTRLALDSSKVLEAYRFRWDMSYTYHVSPTYSEIQNFNFGNGAEHMFMNGQVAMMCSGVWHTVGFLQKKDLDFDVTEFPMGPHGTRGWGTGGTGCAMWKGSKNKDKAWEVIKELAGAELVTQLTQTGMLQPALVKVAQSDAFLKSPGAANKKILLEMPQNSHYAPFLKGWSEIWNGQVGPGMDPVWMGNKTPEEAVPQLNAAINKKYFGKP